MLFYYYYVHVSLHKNKKHKKERESAMIFIGFAWLPISAGGKWLSFTRGNDL